MKVVRVGVVGCGRNIPNHLRVYADSPSARLVAVCDRNEALAREQGRRFGAQRILNDYDSLLAMDLDLVDVVTPPLTHSDLTIRALEAGHNVLVEKPMASSSEECEKMIHAARRAGRTLCVNHNKLFFDAVRRIKSTIEDEQLPVRRVDFTHFFTEAGSSRLRPWALVDGPGGILWDMMVHHAYLISHFVGEIQSVYAVANKLTHSIPDSCTTLAKGRHAQGVGQFALDAKEPLARLRVFTKDGDWFEGDFVYDFAVRRSREYRGLLQSALRSLSDDVADPVSKWMGILGRMVKLGSFENGLPFKRTFFMLIGTLISYLTGASEYPPVTPEEGLASIRLLEAAQQSIETGIPQRVDRNV